MCVYIFIYLHTHTHIRISHLFIYYDPLLDGQQIAIRLSKNLKRITASLRKKIHDYNSRIFQFDANFPNRVDITSALELSNPIYSDLDNQSEVIF